ncbi:MAG: ribosome maturation factor RimP [Betaproteobacteria bacterium]|nr:MAG: ribosome maturation factor RimP [Betaproteobacteria bacterium]TAG45744.1 MAG: ribosome maturation factor RimP [Betaproteobacteria bacterium]
MGLGPFFFVVRNESVSTSTQEIISSVLAKNGYELVEAEFVRARDLWRVFIDRPESRRGVDLITVEDCAVVSNLLSDTLTERAIPYEHLEVSSPGMDRALTKPEHFERFAGEVVRVTVEPPIDGDRKIVGQLLGFEAEQVKLNVEGAERLIPYSLVTRARVVPQF